MRLESFSGGFAITKSDTVDFGRVTRAIYVGGAGTMVVVMADRTELPLAGCLAGTIYDLRAVRVNSTSTTATNMVGLY